MRTSWLQILWVLAPALSVGQGMDEAQQRESLVKALAIPETPAFSVLGVTPSEVTKPGVGRDVAIGLLQGLDANGHFQSGLAYEFTPYLIIDPAITLQEYRNSWWRRAGASTKLSIATSKGSDEDDESLRASLGVRTTLFDLGDPYGPDPITDQCFDAAMPDSPDEQVERNLIQKRVARGEITIQEKGVLDRALNDRKKSRVEAAAERCRKNFESRHWNSTALDVGVAPVWQSPDGSTSDFEQQGYALWASFQWGFEQLDGERALVGCGSGVAQRLRSCGTLQLLAKLRTQELVADPLNAGALAEQDSMRFGFRFRYGSKDRKFLAESTYADLDRKVGASADEWRYIIGGEFKLTEDMWVQLTFGTVDSAGASTGIVSTQFAWAFADTSAL